MKTAMKKLFSLVLVAVLLVGVMPFRAFAAEPVHVYVELEPGRYTIDDAFVSSHYNGSGTPTKYYVHEKGFPGDTFELGETTTVLLVIEEFAPVAEPDVCGKCNGSHKTEECTLVECTVCGTWTDHGANAHCTECKELKSVCPVTCPGNENYVAPKATVLIRAKAPSDAAYPDGGEFKVEAGTYSVNEIFGKANFSREHNGYCITGTGIDGQRNQGQNFEIVAGGEYYLWIELKETTQTNPDPDADADSDVCSVCGKEEINNMCTGCYLDEADCTCAQTTTPDNDRGKYTLILDFNYRGAKKTTMKVDPEASVKELIASIPAPTRDGHQFSHWTMDAAGADLVDDEVVTKKGTTIYAQWDDDLAVGGKLTLRVDLNYDRKMGEEIINIKKGTKMSDVLDYVPTPTRWKYKFDGWYWDRKCTEDVSSDDRLYNNATIYAKWERRKTNNEIMLKVYLNGNTKSVAKVVDMYEYSRDGKISISEVKEAVSAYYTGKDADGLEFSGLFEAEGWSEYVANRKHAKGEKRIVVNKDEDTTVYVMVYNAKVRTSSSSGTADSSNPKTGDMIFTAVTVMGASAACLAALLYLNKKRAI